MAVNATGDSAAAAAPAALSEAGEAGDGSQGSVSGVAPPAAASLMDARAVDPACSMCAAASTCFIGEAASGGGGCDSGETTTELHM